MMWGVIVLGLCSSAPLTHSQVKQQLSRREFSKLNIFQRAAFFEETIAAAAKKENVDPPLLWTIAYNETRFRPWLTSPKNAKGLMQFIPATAARFGLTDPYEPVASIYAAARYVKVLSDMFGGRMDSILAAYNAGEGAVSAYLNGHSLRVGQKIINSSKRRTLGGVPPYGETIAYVRRGFDVYKALKRRKPFPTTSETIAGVKGRNTRDDANTKASHLSEVFYDPRSGNRVVIGSQQNRALDSGPVIISPAIRSSLAARARTTFFREPKR